MKRKNLDAYVSFVQSMHVSTSARRDMMNRLCAETETQSSQPEITRTREPSAAWLRFERISGLAAMLILFVSAGLLIYHTAKTEPVEVGTPVVCSVPEQYTDEAFSDYFEAVKPTISYAATPGGELAVAAYHGCVERQQQELKQLQHNADNLAAGKDHGGFWNPWEYLTPANLMRRILLSYQGNEADSVPLRTFGIGWCKEEGLLYFTVVNTADTDAVFRTDITLRDYDTETELVHDNAALPLWQRGYMKGYLCDDPLRERPNGQGHCITVPAHSAAELTLAVPEGTDLCRDYLALDFYGTDKGKEPAYTKYFELDDTMLLMPREQEAALLTLAAEHSRLEY